LVSRPSSNLPPGIPVENSNQRQLLELIGRIGMRLGTRTFLVGGPVRDMMLGHASPDLDVAVESSSRRFGRTIAHELGGRFLYHRRFMTGTVTLSDSSHVDITQTRTEEYPRPAVLPSVKPATIDEDLVRRDFTINAMALELTPRAFGRIIDPHSGRADLSGHLVRVLHDRSFVDDPTRVFRCIRFAVRLGFEIEPRTLELMRQAIVDRYPALLTPERILYELRLICAEPLVLQMVEALVREKVFEAAFLPDGDGQPGHLLPDLARLVQGRATPDLLFIYLLSTLPVSERFPIRREERDAADAVNRFGPTRARLARARRRSTTYRLLRPIPEPALRILALLESGAAGARIADYLGNLCSVKTEITGRDLRALGLEPGPRYRQTLDRLLCARLDGRTRTREDELALCRRLLRRVKS